ncbi:uncharacterized protein IUM83_04944 [Phytophthora cinnamomi]|uniref:uncharacterized protein n=1 Tax=Phytophthora cinnamomi TaxID=4785 RepID=UPI003559D96E|nr:hypothetical protein IUM83_04944 [Phytophthora cinnamomi]
MIPIIAPMPNPPELFDALSEFTELLGSVTVLSSSTLPLEPAIVVVDFVDNVDVLLEPEIDVEEEVAELVVGASVVGVGVVVVAVFDDDPADELDLLALVLDLLDELPDVELPQYSSQGVTRPENNGNVRAR